MVDASIDEVIQGLTESVETRYEGEQEFAVVSDPLLTFEGADLLDAMDAMDVLNSQYSSENCSQ